jgi:hypothetical protein
MGNVLSEEKREQIIALGRLEWFLRRLATGVRRETPGGYLRSEGGGSFAWKLGTQVPGKTGHFGDHRHFARGGSSGTGWPARGLQPKLGGEWDSYREPCYSFADGYKFMFIKYTQKYTHPIYVWDKTGSHTTPCPFYLPPPPMGFRTTSASPRTKVRGAD